MQKLATMLTGLLKIQTDHLNITLKEGFVGCLMIFSNPFLSVSRDSCKPTLLFLILSSFLMVLLPSLVTFE